MHHHVALHRSTLKRVKKLMQGCCNQRIKAHNQLTQYPLPPYCKAPTRPLRSHHLHSYQTIPAMHDPYLYSYIPRTLRVWSILPVQISCAASLECFKSRIVTAYGTGTIVIVPPKSIGRSTGAATSGQLLYLC